MRKDPLAEASHRVFCTHKGSQSDVQNPRTYTEKPCFLKSQLFRASYHENTAELALAVVNQNVSEPRDGQIYNIMHFFHSYMHATYLFLPREHVYLLISSFMFQDSS